MSSQPMVNNQLLGCLSWSEESSRKSIQIAGTRLLARSKSSDDDRWQLQFFGTPNTILLSGSAPHHNATAYLWGTVAHPDIENSQIPAWAAQIVAERRYERLKELLGYFVIFVDEPERRRLSVVSDILGVRPLFYRRDNERIIFGSDAWLLQHAGLTSGEIDWDAVSSWILQGCNYTDKALFTDLRRLEAGSVVSFEETRREVIPYVHFSVSDRMLPSEEAAEGIHAIMKPVCKTIYSRYEKMHVALSGGYDSRYCLAMALEENADIDKITFQNAARTYRWDAVERLGRENCNVGAMRAQAGHVDLTPLKGGGKPPAEHQGTVRARDIMRLFPQSNTFERA